MPANNEQVTSSSDDKANRAFVAGAKVFLDVVAVFLVLDGAGLNACTISDEAQVHPGVVPTSPLEVALGVGIGGIMYALHKSKNPTDIVLRDYEKEFKPPKLPKYAVSRANRIGTTMGKSGLSKFFPK